MKPAHIAFALLCAASGAALAQMPQRPNGPAVLTSPDPVVQGHITAAQTAAGSRWADRIPQLCNLALPDRPDSMPMRDKPAAMPEVADWPEAPAKIFDNVYFVGSKGVSAFAIDTPDGIIITDAMWSYDVAQSVEGGLVKMGLDPRRIRYVIIPHGHPDHYGGAQYLHDKFGAKIIAPKGDLGWIAHGPTYDTTPIPKAYDRIIDDGDTLSLGGTTLRFSVMPGHTPGGIVMSFPVTDKGKPHHMLIWSAGSGGPNGTEGQARQAAALDRLLLLARSEGFDALADNHGSHLLVEQMRSAPGGGNPFLMPRKSLDDYLVVRRECNLARLANTALSKPVMKSPPRPQD